MCSRFNELHLSDDMLNGMLPSRFESQCCIESMNIAIKRQPVLIITDNVKRLIMLFIASFALSFYCCNPKHVQNVPLSTESKFNLPQLD